jgi:hypothetical protein
MKRRPNNLASTIAWKHEIVIISFEVLWGHMTLANSGWMAASLSLVQRLLTSCLTVALLEAI